MLHVDVRLSGTPSNAGGIAAKVALGLLIGAAVLAPGVFWPPYWRIVATALFAGLILLTGRTLLASLLGFRRPADPPAKPDGVEWPTVTILVPAYNEANVLPRSMASLRHLDYPKEKLEFVYTYEAKSTDGTGHVIREHAGSDPRYLVLERRNARSGKAAAVNDALPHCTGELLIGLDADQALKPDAVSRVARWFLAEPDLACVKARPIGINASESSLALVSTLERDSVERGDTYLRELMGGFTFFGGGQVAFRRSLFNDLGGYDEEMLLEDIDYSVKIHEAGHRIKVDPGFITYEEHPAGLRAWWGQRLRWVRGGMQVARRYVGRSLAMPRLKLSTRIDLVYTLVLAVLSAGFVLLTPLGLMGLVGADTSTYLPPAWQTAGWMFAAAAPVASWLCVWAQDRRQGIHHAPREWLALPFVGYYMAAQAFVYASAFLDEFVLNRPSVFVKTAKTGQLPKPARFLRPVPALEVLAAVETGDEKA